VTSEIEPFVAQAPEARRRQRPGDPAHEDGDGGRIVRQHLPGQAVATVSHDAVIPEAIALFREPESSDREWS
jgi:hypothetical protein